MQEILVLHLLYAARVVLSDLVKAYVTLQPQQIYFEEQSNLVNKLSE